MPDIQLPDGAIATFPEDMSEEEIAAALARALPHKDAVIQHLAEVDRYLVSRAGVAQGYRRTMADAIALADGLPPPQRAVRLPMVARDDVPERALQPADHAKVSTPSSMSWRRIIRTSVM